MDNAVNERIKINLRSVGLVSLLSIVYLLISYLVVGYQSDQVVLLVIFNTMFYLSSITRKSILGFSIFIVYWIIFDYMKAIPNYSVNAVHIADLYNFEKRVFGIHFNNLLITPNEYWRLNRTTFLDVLSGIFYLCWIPVPLMFAIFLFFRSRQQFLYFALTFFLVNLIGFAVYYIYPAAPPWYMQYYGHVFHAATRGNTAGLVYFDKYFNVAIFKSIYAKSSNVFAAMPSLHASYPIIVLYYGLKNRLGLFNILLGIIMGGIWFSAVYTGHHYLVDVLAGIICAIIGLILFNKVFLRSKPFLAFLDRYERLIQ